MPAPKKQYFTQAFTDRQAKALFAAAKDLGVSVQEIVRQLVDRWLMQRGGQ